MENEENLEEVAEVAKCLLPYYSNMFPFKHVFDWLSYGDPSCMPFREISTTTRFNSYLRYKSFFNVQHFKVGITRNIPFQLNIGAVYNIFPEFGDKKVNVLSVVEKELVFDLDISDYDDTRTCCTGNNICSKCWIFMVVACKVLTAGLKEAFGFQHILWVFSGRRGIHCWVCDKKARILDNEIRTDICEFFLMNTGYKKTKNKFNLNEEESESRLSPFVKRAVEIIKPFFPRIVVEQDLLGTKEQCDNFEHLFPNELRDEVNYLMNDSCSSFDRWDAFQFYLETNLDMKEPSWCSYPYLLEELLLYFAYPRIDAPVTESRDHLLRCPFSVHTGSGRICIPIDVDKIDSFETENVPTVISLVNELENIDVPHQSAEEILKQTSLREAILTFEKFLKKLDIDKRIEDSP